MQSRPLNLNFEERGVWNTMKRALKEHNSYNVRQKFYPQNMDSWEKEHKEIEQRYREFFRSRFNADMDDLVRIDVLEIIRSYLPTIHEKISQE